MTGDSGELGSRAPRAWAAVDHHDAAAASSGLRVRVGPGPPGPGPNPLGGTQARALKLASEIIMMIIAHCRIFNFMFKFALFASEAARLWAAGRYALRPPRGISLTGVLLKL